MKKTLTMVLAFALIFALGIGATLAWLTDNTEPVVNTFSPSDISITLAESDNLNLKMVPGHTIEKDPVVTVKAKSEPCYLFVKVEKGNNFDSFMTYEMATGWKQLTDKDGKNVTGVFYREVAASTDNQEFSVLKDDQVTVKDTVTKTMMNSLTDNTRPTLTFTAYASQLYKNNTATFTAAEAWTNAQPAPSNP